MAQQRPPEAILPKGRRYANALLQCICISSFNAETELITLPATIATANEYIPPVVTLAKLG